MSRKAYLTIDDTPSTDTDALTGFLTEHGVSALLFCRGDRLEANPGPAARAIERGFVLGNHAYSHRRASEIGFDEMVAEIEATEKLIEAACRSAGKTRPAKYFRFPHMDRGTGGWVVDYEAAPPEHRETLIRLFSEGLNISLSPPHPEQVALKTRLQDWLRAEGFAPPPFAGVTFPWYAETEMARAVDAMFTFSTSDWMVTPRHAGKWTYKTVNDLIRKIDADPWLAGSSSAHIILAHDQDGLLDTVRTLVLHMQDQGIEFQAIGV